MQIMEGMAMSRKNHILILISGAFIGAVSLLLLQHVPDSVVSSAEAAGGVVEGPNVVAPDRYVYYPGTEVLAEDEVRVVACGTGMPDQRRGQASACFLFEFGNGEKLIFDIGSGSMRNINALMIPAEYLTKVFVSHLHTDHWGDLDSLWAGGWTAGRPVPLEVWGPSGQTEDMGTAYAIDGFRRAFNWDYQTRAFKITPLPGQITVHEFEYKAVNQVVFDQNGIVIRSIPAIHAGDGPVSFIIEYAGLKLVFGGDTSPNKWFAEFAKGADFVIHEAFAPPEYFTKDYGQPPQLAWRACCEFHTSGPSFGKIMSEIEPGLDARIVLGDAITRIVGKRLEGPLGPTSADEIDCCVHRDPVQPGIESTAGIVAAQPLPELQEHSLGNVQGIVHVAGDLIRDAHHSLALEQHELVESTSIAGDRLLDAKANPFFHILRRSPAVRHGDVYHIEAQLREDLHLD